VKLLFLTQVIDAQDAILGFVPRWIQSFARTCERVRVVALDVGDVSTLPDNVDVRRIGRRGRVGRWLRYRATMREALRKDGFDTVLAHMVPRYSLLAHSEARRAGAREFLWYTHAGVDRRLERAVSIVEKVFTASPESLRVDDPKRVVTGHGIDLGHFGNRGEISVAPPRLITVGRLTPAKDPLTVLGSLSVLVERGFDVHLDVIGGGLTELDTGYVRSIHEEIERLKLGERVHLTGAVPYLEIPAYYRRASCLVSASRTGSVDKVVLEAMAAGRPVVTCNDSFPRVFESLGDEASSLLFEPGDVMGLADRVGDILSQEPPARAALGERLRAIVARDHELERLCDRLVREMGGDA
jgi:glycosyltransferase involved in cell wall biosynthesis